MEGRLGSKGLRGKPLGRSKPPVLIVVGDFIRCSGAVPQCLFFSQPIPAFSASTRGPCRLCVVICVRGWRSAPPPKPAGASRCPAAGTLLTGSWRCPVPCLRALLYLRLRPHVQGGGAAWWRFLQIIYII